MTSLALLAPSFSIMRSVNTIISNYIRMYVPSLSLLSAFFYFSNLIGNYWLLINFKCDHCEFYLKFIFIYCLIFSIQFIFVYRWIDDKLNCLFLWIFLSLIDYVSSRFKMNAFHGRECTLFSNSSHKHLAANLERRWFCF